MRYTAEAEKLKWTYLAALEACLVDREPDERQEMVETIQHHLEDAAGELGLSSIDGPSMKELIERVGDVDVLSKVADEKTTGVSSVQPVNIGFKEEASRAFRAQWAGVVRGYTIRVVNKWNLLLFGSGLLYVDNELVDTNKGWMNYSCTLSATIVEDGGEKLSVNAYLGNKDAIQGVICRVWVNGEQISMGLLEG